MLEKCRHYLAHPEERRRIAEAGRRRCHESGYFEPDRVREIVPALEELLQRAAPGACAPDGRRDGEAREAVSAHRGGARVHARRGRAADRPASYAEFDTSIPVSSGRALKAAIEGGTPYIFVRRGTYVLDNPVVIDRGHSLFVHGADRTQTWLVAADPTRPLFVVKRAPLVNFAGLAFEPTRDAPSTANARAIATQNREPLVFEMLDCGVGAATLAFEGPGRYRIQTPILAPHGRVRAAVWVDHPDADVLVFAGDATNAAYPLRSGDDDFAFVWQKRGRVRVHATTVQGGLGQGDVRIESASKLGPHVIANVRSEGVTGPLAHSGAVSRFLYVPPTSERVDVVLKANGGAWDTGPRTTSRSRINCSMIAYHGAGTVWLIGNRAEGTCGRHIAEGKAPAATIVSVGNLISSPEAFAIQARRIISAADSFHSGYWTGNPNAPDPDRALDPRRHAGRETERHPERTGGAGRRAARGAVAPADDPLRCPT